MSKNRKFPNNLRSKEHIFYLQPESIDNFTGNVWFINNSEETLTEVRNASGGFASDDDDVIIMDLQNPAVYKDIKPGEAVQIDDYDIMIDSDFMIQYAVDVTAPSFGKKTFKSELEKGGRTDETLSWKPVPPELSDPDNPEELLSPEKAAEDYMERTGRSLNKKISLNRGDLKMDYAAKRLAPSGVLLEKCYHHDGNITEYKFSDESGNFLFGTSIFLRACLFVEHLRGDKKSQAMNDVLGFQPK